MRKILVFCAFLAYACALQGWIGSWFIVEEGYDLAACDVPVNLTIVNITRSPDHGNYLVLSGLSAFYSQPETWELDWTDSQQTADYCDNTIGWCISSNLTRQNGATYASILWFSNIDTLHCTSFLTPATLNWAGRWLVTRSHADQNCPVPKAKSVVNIQDNGDQLLLVGYDSKTKALTNWTLNFTAQEQHVDEACIESSNSCVKADMGVHNWLLTGNLSWVNNNTWNCNATLTRLPPSHSEIGVGVKSDLVSLNYQENEELLLSEHSNLNKNVFI